MIIKSIYSIIYNKIMIRHTVEIKKNPQLRNAELLFYLPGIKDGEIVKLTQHSHLIYITFRTS